MRGYNDDLVMALAIGCWVRDVAMTVNKRDIEYSKAMLSGITTAGRTLNTSIPGMREYQQRPKSEQTTKDGIKYDISWIYKG